MKYRDYPGYQEPTLYDIYHCSSCDTSFANPLVVNGALYDLVYSKIDQVPGYNRYAKYASDVLECEDPLAYLAHEDVYWSVKDYVEGSDFGGDTRILEAGSGLGYLTYAIKKRGLDIVGLESSRVAVDASQRRYGNLFICADLVEHSKSIGASYDVVIMTELVEHVADVHSLLLAVRGLLVRGGQVLLTTPNKSTYSSHVPWNTAAPPMHLWWLSETSIKHLAHMHGFSLSFTDFTEFNKEHNIVLVNGQLFPHHPFGHVLDVNGNVCSEQINGARLMKNMLRSLGLVKIGRAALVTLMRKNQDLQNRSGTMCAVLTKC